MIEGELLGDFNGISINCYFISHPAIESKAQIELIYYFGLWIV